MLQKIFEFLFSLDRVSLTPQTRFEFAPDPWVVPALLGVMIGGLVVVMAAIVWAMARGQARSQKYLPILLVLGGATLILGIWFPFAYVSASQGAALVPIGLVITMAAALVIGVGYWSYRAQSTTPGKRLLLGVIRAAVLVTVLLLFCRPQLVLDREEKTRSVVAVWVDNSASMTLEDPYKEAQMRELVKLASMPGGATTGAARRARVNRYELALASLAKAQWIKNLAESQDVAIYSGSSHAQPVGIAHAPEQVANVLESLKKDKPTGESTDVPTVVQEILQSVQGQRVSAIVLLTDGQTTEKGSRLDQAVQAAQRSSAKVFALPLGQTEEPLDFKLANLQVPENTFVKDPVAAKAHLSGTGIDKPTAVKVGIYRVQGGVEQLLASKEFTLDPTKKEMDVEVTFKPEKKGADKFEKFDLIGGVEPATAGAEELTLANNSVAGHTNVLDAKMNVLLVEGYPRWEYRYLKNELIREKTIDVSTLLLSADENFAQEGDIPITRFPETAEELAKYDVLLIGDVEPTFFSQSQQKLIVDFVKKSGGGIGWIAGAAYNPESYKGTTLEVLLPIVPDEMIPAARVMAPSDNTAFNLVMTAAGKETNLFRFFDDSDLNTKQLAELPEMYWYKPIQGLKGSAEVLAVHPTRSIGGAPLPLIVTGRYGEGRTLFSGVCDTWRWRRYTGEPLFQSYWLQMCRLLYRNKALGQSRRIELAAETSRVEIGQPIRVSMDIKDPTLASQVPSQVAVQVIDAQGRAIESIMLNRTGGSQDKLTGVTTATLVGPLTLQVQPGVLPVDVASYELEITPPGREFEKTAADIESLTLISTKTTGQLLPLWRDEELLKLIPDRSIPALISLSEELWPKPIALVLVVLLVTIEWLVRKAAGLI